MTEGLLADYLRLYGGGSNTGAGGSLVFKDLPLWDGATGSANINGMYSPQQGLISNGFDLILKQALDKKKEHELMLRYGQDQMQNPSYGVQYNYTW